MQEIIKNQATASLRRVYFDAVNATNPTAPLSAADMDIGGAGAFTVKWSKNGAAPATPTGAVVTEVSAADQKGMFYVELDATDVDTGGIGVLVVSSAGGASNMVARRIIVRIKDNTTELKLVVYGARTVQGILYRLDRWMIGRAEGLNGSTATFYDEDEVTPAIESTQNTAAGTRTEASTAAGD